MIKSTMNSTLYEMSEELNNIIKEFRCYISDADIANEAFISNVMRYIHLITELSELRGKKSLISEMSNNIQNLQCKSLETLIKMSNEYMENNKNVNEITQQSLEISKKILDSNKQMTIHLSHIAKSLADISRNNCIMFHRD